MAECRAQLLQEATIQLTKNPPYPVSVQVLKEQFHRKNQSNTDPLQWDAMEIDSSIHLKINPLPQKSSKNQKQPNVLANDLCILIDRADLSSSSNSTHGLVTHAQVTRQKSLHNLIVQADKRYWAKYGHADEMYLIVLPNNVTAWREFTALCHLEQLPLKRFLLGQHLEQQQQQTQQQSSVSSNTTKTTHPPLAQLSTRRLLEKMGGKDALGKGFLEYASNKFNASQLTAIAASAHEYGEGGFTLIKGPPGTGSECDERLRW